MGRQKLLRILPLTDTKNASCHFLKNFFIVHSRDKNVYTHLYNTSLNYRDLIRRSRSGYIK